MSTREQQRAYESAVKNRDMYMGVARRQAGQRWDAIFPGARERLERSIKRNVRKARKANHLARSIWNER